MFCPKCGTKNDDNARFCGSCGAPLNRTAQPSAPTASNAAGAAPRAGSYTPGKYSQPGQSIGGKVLSNPALASFGMNSIDKLLGLIGLVVLIIAVFVPFMSVDFLGSSASFSLFMNDGEVGDSIFILGLAIADIVLLFLNKRKPYLIVGCITVAFALFELINTTSSINQSGYSSLFNYGAGFVMLIIGMIVLAGSLYFRVRELLAAR